MHVFQRKNEFGFSLTFRHACSRTRACSRARLAASATESAHASHTAKYHFKEIAESATALLSGTAEEIVHVDGALKSAPVWGWREIGAVLPIRSELVIFSALVGVA